MTSVDNSQFVPTTFKWQQLGDNVCVAGSFGPSKPAWTPIEMPKNSNGVHEVVLNLLPNKKYCYKFVVDGSWVLDPSLQQIPDEHGNYNHEICVDPVPDENIENEENPQLVPQKVEEQTEMNQNDEKVGESNVTEENDQFSNESLDQQAQTEKIITQMPVIGEPFSTASIIDNDELSAKNIAIENPNEVQSKESHESDGTSQIITEPIKVSIKPVEIVEDVDEISISLYRERKGGADDEISSNIPPQGTVQIEDPKISATEESVQISVQIPKVSEKIEEPSKEDSGVGLSSKIEMETGQKVDETADANFETAFESELDPINEDEDEGDDYDDYDYDNDDYGEDNENPITADTTVVDPSELENFQNFSWAKDDLSDDDVASSWLEPPVVDYIEPHAEWTVSKNDSVVWAEDSPDSSLEWPNIAEAHAKKEQLSSTWSDETISEETEAVKKSEEHAINEGIQSREETTTEQTKHSNEALLNEIPSSTNINDSLENTLLVKNDEEPPVKTTFVAEEKKEKKKVLEFKESVVESDQGVIKNKLIIKETITCPTVEVKEKVEDEPSLVDTEPESSATAFMKIPSMSTVIAAAPAIVDNTISQDYLGQDIEKETQPISNAPAGKISQPTLSSREIVSTPTKETTTKKSKTKKSKEMATSRQKDQILVVQRNDIVDSGGGLIFLVTSLATTFTLGIISMLYKAVFGKTKNR